jgi:hypothetical protein
MNIIWRKYSTQLPLVPATVCNKLYVDSAGVAHEENADGRTPVTKIYHEKDNIPTTQFIPSATAELLTSGESTLPFFKNIVVLGASLMQGMFGRNLSTPNAYFTNYVQNTLGLTGTNVYGYGFSGENTNSFINANNRLQEVYDTFPDPATLLFVHIGGNDVTDNRPYDPENNYASLVSNIQAIETLARARGQAVIFGSLTFRSYLGSNSPSAIFDDESLGSLPFWENVFYPVYAGNFYVRPDKRSVVDLYNFIRNYHTGILSTDGIHIRNYALNTVGTDNLPNRLFGEYILNSIYNFYKGTPIAVERRPPVTDYAAIVSQSSDGIVDASVFPYCPNNFMGFSNVDACNSFSTTLRTPTGHPLCSLSTNTDITASWGPSGIGRSTSGNNISTVGFDYYDTFNDNIERTKVALSGNIFFNNGYLQFNLSGLTSGNYRAEFSCARALTRTTRCTHIESGVFSTMTANTATPWGSLDFTVADTTATLRFASNTTGYGDISCLTLRKL